MKLNGEKKTAEISAVTQCPHGNFGDLQGLNQMMSFDSKIFVKFWGYTVQNIKLKTKNKATIKKSEK